MKSILLFPLLLASSVMAQEPDTSSALYHMREAELNFARASVTIGRNAAFVDNFAEKSVIFTDKWIDNAKQFWQEHKALPIVLKWEPEYMDISDSRDFGISTGPWEVQEYRPNTSTLSTGYFLTVWKMQSDGVWQVILDAGSTTPPPTGTLHMFSFPSGADKVIPKPPKMNTESFSDELLERENQILTAWEKSPTTSIYFTFLDPDIRMQRNGHLPTGNRDTINLWIANMNNNLTWHSSGSEAASSGDLGYTYGILEKPANPVESRGHYVRIWKKHPGGKWNIILEMFNLD